MKATIRWNEKKTKYELVHKGEVLVTSKQDGYLNYLVKQQKHAAILKHKITEVVYGSHKPDSPTVIQDAAGNDLMRVAYPIADRFKFMKQMIGMVVNKTARSIIISGEGGIGKTYSVLECLEEHGKQDFYKMLPNIETLNLIKTPDSEQEMLEKAAALANMPTGDYVLIKGYSSAAALYRILFEHKNRIIVFDDCDSVLKDATALGLLKSALDSYEERWVSWRVERLGDSDLPQHFKFEGSIVFVSNLPLSKIDEAVKTRAFKVDLSMTKPQRIEWMRERLPGVLPHIDDLSAKHDALNLLEEHMHLTNDVNFRTLMAIISIRVDPNVPDWKALAKFTITEQ